MSVDLTQALLLFAGSAVVVIFSGVFLSRYGDALAELLMGWGRLWVGTILVATATSLPELVTSITAVSRNDPELAGGNILGSNMVSMFTLAMLALLFRGAHFFRRVSPEQKFLVLTAISLTSFAVILGAFNLGISFLGVGLASVLVLALYVAGMRLVYVTRPQEPVEAEADSSDELPSLRKAWMFFGLASVGVILAAVILVYSVEQIADITGLSTSFLGVVAVALVTTMPEASTTIAAVRSGALDLAVGTLYGSCVFNILILALADPFYRQGTLVETLEIAHIAAGLVAIFLMGLGLGQILLRGNNPYVPVVPTLVVMGFVYIGGLFAVYTLG